MITRTLDEVMQLMIDRESPDDILDILDPTSNDLVEGLQHLIERDFDSLLERYDE